MIQFLGRGVGKPHGGRGIYLLYLAVNSVSSNTRSSICLIRRGNGQPQDTAPAVGSQNEKEECPCGAPLLQGRSCHECSVVRGPRGPRGPLLRRSLHPSPPPSVRTSLLSLPFLALDTLSPFAFLSVSHSRSSSGRAFPFISGSGVSGLVGPSPLWLGLAAGTLPSSGPGRPSRAVDQLRRPTAKAPWAHSERPC